MDGSIDTQRTEIHEALQGHLQVDERTHQVLRTLCVDTIEIAGIQAFRHAGSMHHVVERMFLQLLFQLRLIAQVQFYEMDTLVLQEVSLTTSPDGSPRLKPALQRLFHDKRANESAGSCNEYLHRNFEIWVQNYGFLLD